jgi:hypothetical protein
VVTQRFGGVRYALSRPGLPFTADAPTFETFQAERPGEPEAGTDGRPFWLAWPWQPTMELPDGGESDAHR